MALTLEQILAAAEKVKRAAPSRRPARKPGLSADQILAMAEKAKRKTRPKSTRKGKHAVMRDTLGLRDMRRDGQPVGLDLFAGAGGFGLGAERAGLEAVGVQRNPLAVRTARRAGLRTHELDVGELGG